MSTVYEFTRRVTAGSFAEVLAAAASKGALDKSICINLEKVTYIDLQALFLLVALCSRHVAKDRKLTIRLPESNAVTEFLAAWELIAALEDVLETSKSRILSRGDLQKLSTFSKPTNNRYMQARQDQAGILQRLYSNRFFSMQVFRRQPPLFKSSLAVRETERWRELLVQRILRKMLPGSAELFCQRIVFEAMMNAIRHPNASRIVTASQLHANRSLFSIGFWDDGRLIPSTLRSALSKDLSVKGGGWNVVNCAYLVEDATGNSETIEPRVPTDALTPDSDLLLASTFPGITCDPAGLTRPPNTTTPPGMGLYYLLNATVSVFGGQVILHSGRSRLVIQSADDETGELEIFKVKKTALPMSFWLKGNFVWITIPTKPVDRV